MKLRIHADDWHNEQFIKFISEQANIPIEKFNDSSLFTLEEKIKIQDYILFFSEILNPENIDIDQTPEQTDFEYESLKETSKTTDLLIKFLDEVENKGDKSIKN